VGATGPRLIQPFCQPPGGRGHPDLRAARRLADLWGV